MILTGDLIVDKVQTVIDVVPQVVVRSETVLPVKTEPTSPTHLVALITTLFATTFGIDLVAAAAKDRAVPHRAAFLGQTFIVQTHQWQVDAVPIRGHL